MRLLHTSDWHLGDRLGDIDRTADQFRCLDRLLGYCDEYRVDVLVVAGDIFNEYQGERLSLVARELGKRLAPRLANGLRAVFLAGNHDREHFFRLLEVIQVLTGEEGIRRIHFVGQPKVMSLTDSDHGFPVQFVLAPYPFPDRYLPDYAGVRGLGHDERRQAIARAYASRITAAQSQIQSKQRTVMVSHVYIRTGQTSTLFRMTEAEDIPIEPQDLPTWDYVALGHLHKAQVIGNRSCVRYSGSIDRLDSGERADEKSCVLLEISPEGLVEEPSLLSLPATPIYTVEIAGGDNVDGLAQTYPDHELALVNLQVRYRPGEDNPAALVSQLRRIFPRCFKLRVESAEQVAVVRQMDTDPQDQAGTVRAFLDQRLTNHPRREHLLRLASDLVQEVQRAAATR